MDNYVENSYCEIRSMFWCRLCMDCACGSAIRLIYNELLKKLSTTYPPVIHHLSTSYPPPPLMLCAFFSCKLPNCMFCIVFPVYMALFLEGWVCGLVRNRESQFLLEHNILLVVVEGVLLIIYIKNVFQAGDVTI